MASVFNAKVQRSFVLNHVVAILRPYNGFSAIVNWACWARDIELEFDMSSNGRFDFLGWQNMEGFASPPIVMCRFLCQSPSVMVSVQVLSDILRAVASHLCMLFIEYPG